MADHYVVNGKSVLSYEAMLNRYAQLNPDKAPPDRPEKPSVSMINLLALTIVVIAVNILSGAHTIPMIQNFYELPTILSYAIGFSGFIAIEGAMVLLMAQPQRSKLAYVVVFLAFSAALAANMYKTFEIFDANGDIFAIMIAFLFGLFAPATNLVAGEVLHAMQTEYRESKNKNIAEYENLVSQFNSQVQSNYRKYLNRIGIKSPEEQEMIIAGYVDEINATIDVRKEEAKALPEPVENPIDSAKGTVKDLVEDWLASDVNPNDFKLKQLADNYSVSVSTISNARKLYNGVKEYEQQNK